MKRPLPILFLWCLGFLSRGGAEEGDLLRFTNGDQLHGAYQGLEEGPLLRWRREDLQEAVEFQPSRIRQVVLRGGRPLEALPSLSHVALVNGDRIPGEVVAFDGEFITLDTPCAGTLRLPKSSVALFAPSPLGGRVLYQGPFSGDEWMLRSSAGEEREGEEAPWKFSGAAWYWRKGTTGTALTRRDAMPERSVLRFNAAWKNRLSLCVAFHADFSRPEEPGEEQLQAGNRNRVGDASSFPWIFGNGYVLQISNYVILYRVGFDAEGNPFVDPIRTNSNIRLGESGEATVEIRCNRRSGELSLFVDGEFISQWSEGVGDQDYAGKGDGFGFLVQVENSAVRLSEMILAEWNGMPDSARSLQSDDRDVVLLANGTDRFSGKVTAFSDGKVRLEGKYGDFQLPLEEIAEIRFAKNGWSEAEESSGERVAVRMRPIGRISGRPLEGTSSALKLVHPHAGELELNLESAVTLDFNPSNSFLDEWDEQF